MNVRVFIFFLFLQLFISLLCTTAAKPSRYIFLGPGLWLPRANPLKSSRNHPANASLSQPSSISSSFRATLAIIFHLSYYIGSKRAPYFERYVCNA